MKKSNNKILFSNTGFLLIIQAVSYISPLLIIPYLTRVLGVSNYGELAYALSVLQLLYIVTDFGFNFSATRSIAENRLDNKKINKIATSILLNKLILFLLSSLILLAFIFYKFEEINDKSVLFALILIPLFGQTFQAIWFFQGIEKMGYMTIFLTFAKLSYVILTITLVDSEKDINWVMLSNGAAQIAAAFFAVVLMVRLGFRPTWPGYVFMKDTFRESIEFFWARAAAATYTAGGVFFLGTFTNSTLTAYYSAAEQLYNGAKSIQQPVLQALYPFMARTRDLLTFKRLLKFSVLISFIAFIIGFLFGKQLLAGLFGVEFSKSYDVLVTLLIALSVVIPSGFLGYPLLGVFGKSHIANRSIIFGGVINIALLFILEAFDSVYPVTVAMTVLISEIIILSIRIWYSKEIIRGNHYFGSDHIFLKNSKSKSKDD